MKKKNAPKKVTQAPEGASIAQEMAKVIVKSHKAKEQRDRDREADMKANFIEGFEYAPSLSYFRDELNAKKGTEPRNQFFAYLVDQRKAYSNAASFYMIWGGSPAEEKRGEAFKQIADFIQSEIDAHNQGVVKYDTPAPITLKNILTDKGFSILPTIKKEMQITKAKQLWHLYKALNDKGLIADTGVSDEVIVAAFKEHFPALRATRQAFQQNKSNVNNDVLLLKDYTEKITAALKK